MDIDRISIRSQFRGGDDRAGAYPLRARLPAIYGTAQALLPDVHWPGTHNAGYGGSRPAGCEAGSGG